MRNLFKLVIVFGIFIFAFTSVQSTYAVNDNASDTAVEKTTTNSTDKAEKAADRLEAKEARLEAKAEKLSESRLRICQAREDRISNRLTNLMSLGARAFENLDKIVTRVDNFYIEKLAPEGYVLENYDELKADIEANEAGVLTLLGEARSYGQDFSCDGDDPKGQADTFRSSIQDLIAAKKEYRASVRVFVVAVRDLAKEAKADRAVPTPGGADDSTSSADLNSVE